MSDLATLIYLISLQTMRFVAFLIRTPRFCIHTPGWVQYIALEGSSFSVNGDICLSVSIDFIFIKLFFPCVILDTISVLIYPLLDMKVPKIFDSISLLEFILVDK